MPSSVRAVEGSCVVIPCHTSSHTRVIWYKHQTARWPVVHDGENLRNAIDGFEGRTSMPGRSSDGNCSLRIDNVRMSDGITMFPLINPETDKYYKPSVQIKPQAKPRLQISISKSPVREGEEFSLSCSILHSCPPSPPSIHWSGLAAMSPEVHTGKQDGDMWETMSTVRVTAAHTQHHTDVLCHSTFSDQLATTSNSLTLDILYAPVDVALASIGGIITEHSVATLSCRSNSNPRPSFYQWVITNGENTHKVNSSIGYIDVTDAQRTFSAACTAHNPFGARQSLKTSLNVTYVSIVLPESYCSETGGVMRCVCQVDANPTATVTWKLNGTMELPADVVPNVTTRGSVQSSELLLEGDLASHKPVLCMATNGHDVDTQEMTIKGVFPWMWIGVVFGLLGLCGFMYFCCTRRRKSGHPDSARDGDSSNWDMDQYRPGMAAKGPSSSATRPEGPKSYGGREEDEARCEGGGYDMYENTAVIRGGQIGIYLEDEDFEDCDGDQFGSHASDNIYLNR
ncbi:sialoadhesin-like [Engraulis encrasicolus]|uniref:sialoadhesin-like n=1 Tax=Engraulis encrasicolus TaxID=184585 RepID=UPI002FCEFF63